MVKLDILPPRESLTTALGHFDQGDPEGFFRKLTPERVVQGIVSGHTFEEFLVHLQETGKLDGMAELVRYLEPRTPYVFQKNDQKCAVYILDSDAPETARVLGEGAIAASLAQEGCHFRFAETPGLSTVQVNALVDDGNLPEECRIADEHEDYDELLKDL